MMFYTYAHIRPDTGEIFYVGKGSKKRAYSRDSRNNQWNNTVNKNDGKFEVRILNWFNNEDDAFAAEIWQIQQLSPNNILVNKTAGGEGVKGIKRTEEWKAHQRNAALEFYKNNPEFLEEMSLRSIAQFEKPGAKEAASNRTKNYVAKNGLPKGMDSLSKKEQWENEEWRDNIIELQNKGKRTEEARQLKREIANAQWNNPESRSNAMFYWWRLSNVDKQHYWGA